MVGYWRPGRKKKKKNWALFLGLGLTVLLLVYFLFQNIRIAGIKKDYVDRLVETQETVDVLRDRISELELQTDITSQEINLERLARERLNLKKPGEQVIVFEKQELEELVVLTEQAGGLLDRLKQAILGWFKRQ
jgi:cell division protein FtsB